MPQLPSFVGNDSLYCEATHSSDEVLCYGSDDEYYESPLVRINCLEEQARRYLEGRRPFLLSASLRGPFDKGLWQNPWNRRNNSARSSNNVREHPQRRRPTTAEVQSNNASEPASAPTLELGTTPGITIYTDDIPPVSRKRAASADWLRRKNLKRMRPHDAAPAMARSPTLRRGHSADYSRSISVSTGVDGMIMDIDETLLPGRRCLMGPNANEPQDTDKRNTSNEWQQRPALSQVSGSISRSTSAPVNSRLQSTERHQSIVSTEHIGKDGTTDAEIQQQDETVRNTQQVVKAEREDSDALACTDCSTDPTSNINITELEARLTHESLNCPTFEGSEVPLLRQSSATLEEHITDEASQQLLDELNESNETVNIKTEAEETISPTKPYLSGNELELSSASSSATDTDGANNAEDTTRITWHTDDDGPSTGEVEKCDNTTLPETAPLRPSLEMMGQTNKPADSAAASSQAIPMDVRLWAHSVDTSVTSSLTNLPTSPCSPEHAEAASFHKTPVEQVQEPALAVPSSGAPPSTPETKQSSLPTPDMSVSIKSFRRFRSPTPTPPPRRRPNKSGQPRSILSYPRRKSGGLQGTAGRNRCVRFVLPDDDANDGVPFQYTYDLPDAIAEDAEGEDSMGTLKRVQGHGQHGASRTASPPPQDGALTGTLPSEVEKFQEHFASVANRTKQSGHHRASSQKHCSVAVLPGTGSPLQEQRAFWQSPAAVRPENKALDEAADGVDKENQANGWETRGDGEEEDGELPVDDVQEVLDNLDDFLGIWSIDAELAQARSEHT